MYAEVEVIVEGALEESETFSDDVLMCDYVRQVGEDAESHGHPTEVYILYHEHSPAADCQCVQYVVSHKPDYAWNLESGYEDHDSSDYDTSDPYDIEYDI